MKKIVLSMVALFALSFLIVGCVEGDTNITNNNAQANDENSSSTDKPVVAQFTADCGGVTAEGGTIEAYAKVNYDDAQSLSSFSFTVGQKTATVIEEYSNDGKQVDLYGTLRPAQNDSEHRKILLVKFLALTSKGNTLLAKRECEQPALETTESNTSN